MICPAAGDTLDATYRNPVFIIKILRDGATCLICRVTMSVTDNAGHESKEH